MLVHNFRAKFPMKLHVPNDLLFKCLDIFDPVSIMHSPKDFFKDFIAAVLSEITFFYFIEKFPTCWN